MSHVGAVYPSDAAELSAQIDEWTRRFAPDAPASKPSGDLVAMVCPHIDYERGHATYAKLWRAAKDDLDEIELAIILGTDHSGGPGQITPTPQNYATPYGALPTDRDALRRLERALGKSAYDEEIHHISEHSIELAAVWLHYFMEGRELAVAPVLCGSFHHFVRGKSSPSDDEGIGAALEFLREATAGRRTLAIAAGDLAHMGPAFGDALPLDAAARARLAADDEGSIADVLAGDADGFLERSRRELDSRRICGLSPIYLMLKYLEGRRLWGEVMGYDQCTADAEGGSVVSIAGVALYGG